MIVLDASAGIDWLLWHEPQAPGVESELQRATGVHVPHLWSVEVLQVLRRHVRRGVLAPDRANAALEVATDVPTQRYPHEPLAGRIWALRDNLTAYDAAYVALAEVLEVPLVTSDRRLAGAPGHRAEVILVG